MDYPAEPKLIWSVGCRYAVSLASPSPQAAIAEPERVRSSVSILRFAIAFRLWGAAERKSIGGYEESLPARFGRAAATNASGSETGKKVRLLKRGIPSPRLVVIGGKKRCLSIRRERRATSCLSLFQSMSHAWAIGTESPLLTTSMLS